MEIECNLIHQLANLRRQCTGHARTRRPSTRAQTKDPRHAKCSARHTRTQNKNRKLMRALLAEKVPEPPGNVGVGPGTGWRSLRKICAARDAVSQGVLRACMGSEAAHLLDEDAEDKVRAVRLQGVWRPPAAGLTA